MLRCKQNRMLRKKKRLQQQQQQQQNVLYRIPFPKYQRKITPKGKTKEAKNAAYVVKQ